MIADLTVALAQEHVRDIGRAADAGRLARIATCCRPSVVRSRLAELVAWLRHGQLGTGLLDTSAAPITRRGCCA